MPLLSQFLLNLGSVLVSALLAVILLLETLLITSLPLAEHQQEVVDRAVALIEQKGFQKEAFVLRRIAFKRSSDNWLNSLVEKENAFAATNMPFGILTLYPDFYSRTKDDTERAMILLHEARHMLGGNEEDAYSFVWKNRKTLGWTQMTYGTSEVFITVELQTRAHVPGLFNCPDRLWSDCSERRIGR